MKKKTGKYGHEKGENILETQTDKVIEITLQVI